MAGAGSSSTSTETRTVSRAWRRVDPPAWPFVWRGLAPLLVLLGVLGWGLTRFATHTIQAQVEDRTRAALLEGGLGWVHVAVDGQAVTLTGEEPPAGGSAEALRRALDARCPTWLGPQRCAVTVSAAFHTPAPPAPPLEVRWPDLRATLAAGTLTVKGTVPTGADRARLEAQAQLFKGTPRVSEVRSELTESGAPGPAAWEVLAGRVISVAGRCKEGWAELAGGVLSVACTVARADLAELERDVEVRVDGGLVGQRGKVSFLVEEEVAACETSLRQLLEGARIEFATASAELLPSSRPLLERVAGVARSCPGTLRIEGHTDAVGPPAANARLSAARAETVRGALIARGLSPARLVAEGLGADRPLATNDTADGRARNRRIEFHVVHGQGNQP